MSNMRTSGGGSHEAGRARGGTAPGLLTRLTDVVDGLVDVDADGLGLDDVALLLAGVDRQVNRLQAVSMRLTASFSRREGHRESGHNDVQHFLQDRLRRAPSRARREARTADRLERGGLDNTREALARGDISGDHANAIAETADRLEKAGGDATEADTTLLSAARRADPRQVKKAGGRLVQRADAADARRRAQRAYEQRTFNLRDAGESTFVEGRLHHWGGEWLSTVIDALAAPDGKDDDRTPGQRRADALLELCRRAVASEGLGEDGGLPVDVLVTVGVDEIERRSGLEPGTLSWNGPAPPQALEEAVCDAGLSWLITDPRGEPLRFGKSKRFPTRSQRRFLYARDGGCRWPGCPARPRWCLVHHEPDFNAPGGATDARKMVLMCMADHGRRHHGGWRFELDDDATVTVTSPDGAIVLTETAAQARERHNHGHDPLAAQSGQPTRRGGATPPGVGDPGGRTSPGDDMPLPGFDGLVERAPSVAGEEPGRYRAEAGPRDPPRGPPARADPPGATEVRRSGSRPAA